MGILTTILAALAQISAVTTQASVIGNIISMLENIIPAIVAEYKALVPAVKGMIATLSANPETTADQLATLKTFDAATDAAFEDAAAKAQAEDAD